MDESAIKAWHTATYACRADALDAIQSLENCLRSEGFHVLEHILLRPKSSGKPLEEYWQICLNGQPVIKAVQPARDTSDTGRAEFYRNFRKAFKQFFDLEQPRLDWKDERTLEFYLTQPDPNGLATTTLLAVSTYPVDNNCANGFAESLLTLTEADVCLDAEEATADVLFEACVDPADCRDPELPVDCIPGADPYSFWVTVAIPWWGSRFRNLEFRHFVEKTLRREAPAHVGLRIGWLGARQMTELESRYRYWLESNALGDDNCTRQSALNALMETLKNLRNVYPETTLHDCDSGGDGSAFVLLDQTALGED